MKHPESDLYDTLRRRASEHGARLFRNNVGVFQTTTGQTSRMVRCGLGPGSADLVGWTADGRFLAVEVKKKRGKASAQQKAFLAAVRQAGGTAGVCTTPDDLSALLTSPPLPVRPPQEARDPASRQGGL